MEGEGGQRGKGGGKGEKGWEGLQLPLVLANHPLADPAHLGGVPI